MKESFKNQLKELEKIDSICRKFCEWSQSETEADMWIEIHNKTIKLKTYYETHKQNNR